jgi:FkbM family methyltransferase
VSIRDIGLYIVRTIPLAEGVARKVYSWLPASLQDTPTARAQAFFAREHNVSLMQIGAYDGIAGDPVRPLLLKNCGWIGALVEPQPDAFNRLQHNYSRELFRIQLVNAAISDVSGERSLYSVEKDDTGQFGLPDWSAEVASFDPEQVRKHFPSAIIKEQKVKTITFGDVASLLPGCRVDLVVLDVEGYERRIIETVDFDRYCIRFLIYEHKHMSTADKHKVMHLLEGRGFNVKAFGRDTIAWRSLVSDRTSK